LRHLNVLFTTGLVALSAAGTALGQAGGGSSDYGGGDGGGGSGGGGGGDFGGGGGGFDGGGGGEGGDFPLVVWIGIAVVVGLVVASRTTLGRRAMSTLGDLLARPLSLRRRGRRARVRQVELAAAEAVGDHERFAPQHVRSAAETLFREVQKAWDARDTERLATLLGPELLTEWKRRLADFEAKGWHSRAEVSGPVETEYVGLTNREGEDEDRAVVLIQATLRAYVLDNSGNVILRRGERDDTIRLTQYWTLGVREERWALLSIEELSEGKHNVTDPLVATPWTDGDRLRDEAVIETAAADELPAGFSTADLPDLDFAHDAHAAALDLSLADPRFALDVLEASTRRAVAAWAEAVDGEDTALADIATEPALRELLHQGDTSRKRRVVVRGPRVKRMTVVGVDATSEPATTTIEVELEGRRYVQDRDTAAVLSGSRDETTTFTERWTLSLDGSDSSAWRIVAVDGGLDRTAR
jgi:predicted lipid-binding transport protein (Tim44 family)